MSLGPLYVFLGELSVQVLCPFFNWVGVQSCVFFIYFWDQALVWGIIGKYVFPYCWSSFYFNAVFFSHAEVFILMKSHLFILSFMSLALGDMSVRMLLRGMSEIFLPMFSSRTFMVLQIIFKSFIHLEFYPSWFSGSLVLYGEETCLANSPMESHRLKAIISHWAWVSNQMMLAPSYIVPNRTLPKFVDL